MADFEALAWDSEFFGFGVARFAPAWDRKTLGRALEAARSAGVRLAYWLPPASPESSAAAQSLGGSVIGRQARYERSATNRGFDSADARTYESGEPAEVLFPLAYQAGAVSRFAADPRMPPGTAQRMYEIWIRRSVTREIADSVFVTAGGVITVGQQDGCGVVGIIAVDPAQRRGGRGRALIGAALQHARIHGLPRMRVTTQADNVSACALYEACGFERVHTALVVHFWL